MTFYGGVDANELVNDLPVQVVLGTSKVSGQKPGMSAKVTFGPMPQKVGDLLTVSIVVTNTGNTGLSNIVLTSKFLNKGTASFATIPGFFAGWSQKVNA